MDLARFEKITNRYPRLRVAIIGDFCLDRYLEVDPTRQELSIETGLPVHNVINVRSQPGGAGTILNNLAALGVGEIHPVGFCGEFIAIILVRGVIRRASSSRSNRNSLDSSNLTGTGVAPARRIPAS